MILDNALIINEGRRWTGYIVITDELITEVGQGRWRGEVNDVIDLEGKMLIPGVIDTHVHFREPGLTVKADIASESMAAACGGVTSFIDMPNCIPPTVTTKAWQQKQEIAAKTSAINYAFYIGASADNIDVLRTIDYRYVPGVKAFLGQSTGSMQVSQEVLDDIFTLPQIISVHSEDQDIIDSNTNEVRAKYGDSEVPVAEHPKIRSVEACVKCTAEAIERAKRNNTRLHICHVTTADELSLINESRKTDVNITTEACVAHLWFDSNDYNRLGSKIKCNPAVKDTTHRDALRKGVAEGHINVVSTDHAPHLLSDKEGDALTAASGMPSVQFSLQAMIELSRQGYFPLEKVVEVMCHNQARLFGIEKRGFIRSGYYADLTIVDLNKPMTVSPETIKSKCGWSPFEGVTFSSSISQVFVNGHAPIPGEALPLVFTR